MSQMATGQFLREPSVDSGEWPVRELRRRMDESAALGKMKQEVDFSPEQSRHQTAALEGFIGNNNTQPHRIHHANDSAQFGLDSIGRPELSGAKNAASQQEELASRAKAAERTSTESIVRRLEQHSKIFSDRPLSEAAANRAKFAIRSFTIAVGMPKRSRSLVDDARLDTQRNRQLIEEMRADVKRQQTILDETIESGLESADSPSVATPPIREQPLLGPEERGPSREGEEANEKEKETQEQGADTLKELSKKLSSLAEEAAEAERCLVDFPRHISELDHCNHLLIKYEPELDPTHPGFHDLEYRARRKQVAEIAFAYKHGQRIPEVHYNDKEISAWRAIYLRLKEAYAKYACDQHNQSIERLEREAGYGPDSVPQLQRVSEFLERTSGWRLRPVAGLLSARDFLASLAFRVFQTTQYIRHWGNPEHSVEPDCIHELMGHIPMLCDPEFAQFSQELGLASLGASDEQIEKFATLYWFTVEFGLCRERGQLKCYGAGLLSSYGEMEHALESGRPQLKEFVPDETALEQYDDSEYQVVYYVANSFEEAKSKIRDYAARHLMRDSELVYDAYTSSIRQLDSMQQIDWLALQLRADMNRLSQALSKLRSNQQAKLRAQSREQALDEDLKSLVLV